MSESFQRIISIIRVETLFRFRRVTAVVTFLIVASAVYFIVPENSTGRTLIQIDHGRALYTSAAVALGTGMFCTLFLSLIGFYIVSNSLRRDILTRTGLVLAATPVTNAEYIVGKFFGNVLYLTAVMLVCMTSSMVMFLIRGEANLEPLTFLSIYSWLVIPTIAFCSAIAITFEAFPLLSGRFGDVLFFFVWATLLGSSAVFLDNGGQLNWLALMDIVGIVPIIGFLQDHFHTSSISIGSTSYDTAISPVVLNEIPLSGKLLGQRCSTLVLPLALLFMARLWFHRFNPTKVKFSVRQTKKNILTRVNLLLKPATRLLQPFARIGSAHSQQATLLNAVRTDVFTTLLLSPFAIIAIIVFAIISLSVDISALHSGVLPAIAIAIVIAVADIVTRDHVAGMMNLLFTAPHLKPKYILWKCISALIIVLCFTLIPLMRLYFEVPNAALSLLIGSMLITSAAVGLGMLAKSQKPFIAIFLMLLYITLNANDAPVFDFIGVYGKATPDIHFGYALISVLMIVGAHLKYKSELRT